MHVLMLANRKSGVGKAERLATSLSSTLQAHGHTVDLVDPAARARESRAEHDPQTPNGTHNGSTNGTPHDAVVSIGGDGTVFHALPDLLRDQTPVYHVPGGNENLFAREFGMNSQPDRLLAALDAQREQAVDVGTVNDTPFAIMVSVGPDAGVIHRLHERRSRATGHAMYIRPTIAESLTPHLPRLTVTIDGRQRIADTRGFLIVANSRQYALRLDPAHAADMQDGQLDAVFFPAATTAAALGWMGRCLVGRRKGWRGPTVGRGREIVIASADRAPWQADGEAGGWIEPDKPLRLGVRPNALRVLRP